MDDVKLFAQNDPGLQKMVDLVRNFSDDIRMSFGVSTCKCAKLMAKKREAQFDWTCINSWWQDW